MARNGLLAALTGAVLLVGCAGNDVTPPRDTLSEAGEAIERAQQAGAQQFAAFELAKAERKLDRAETLAQRDDDVLRTRAHRLAKQAALDARLAEEQARLASVKTVQTESDSTE